MAVTDETDEYCYTKKMWTVMLGPLALPLFASSLILFLMILPFLPSVYVRHASGLPTPFSLAHLAFWGAVMTGLSALNAAVFLLALKKTGDPIYGVRDFYWGRPSRLTEWDVLFAVLFVLQLIVNGFVLRWFAV